MNRITLTTLAALLIALFVVGCSSDDPAGPGDGNNNNNVADGAVSYTIGTQPRSFTNALAAYNASQSALGITASDNTDQEAVVLAMPKAVGTFTQDAGDGFVDITIIFNGIPYFSKDDVTTITVDSVTDSHVTGTFTGVVASILDEEYTVTNGQFDTDYTDTR